MIRTASLAELRARGAALFEAAGIETGNTGEIQWGMLELLEERGNLVLLAVKHDGELVGYCCATLGPQFWDTQMVCTTLSLFVQPQHRGRYGRALLQALADEGDRLGVPVWVQVLPGSRPERLVKLLGFEPQSVAYVAPNMHYTACHGSSTGNHRRPEPGLRRRLGRAATR